MNLHKLVEVDRTYSTKLRINPQQRGLWKIMAFFAHSGDSWFWLLGLLFLWLLAHGEWRARAVVMVAGVVGLAVLVLVIKFSVRRRRPEGEWGAIYRNTDPHSFPSGHAARAVLLAVLGLSLGPIWFGLVILFWAPLVSLARITMGVHYLSDVLAGWVLGLLVGLIILQSQVLLHGLLPFLF
jgi:undecaprenyl-diphosphatase